MAEKKPEPLEVQADKGGYPKDAYHDPETGMFVMPESKPAEAAESYIKTEEGIFVPRPKDQKEVRVLWTDSGSGNFQYEVEESIEELQAMLDDVKGKEGWVTLTDPIFGFPVVVPMSALQYPVAIVTQLKDMEALKDQMEAYNKQKTLARIEQARKGGASGNAAKILEAVRRNERN